MKIQKKIIRIITFSTYTAHTEPLFSNLKILQLEKLTILRITIQMFKYSNNLVPDAIMNIFTKHKFTHEHNTRHKTNFRHPLGKQDYMYRSFTLKAFIFVISLNH